MTLTFTTKFRLAMSQEFVVVVVVVPLTALVQQCQNGAYGLQLDLENEVKVQMSRNFN